MLGTIGIELFGENTRAYVNFVRTVFNEVSPGIGNVAIGRIPPSGWVAKITGPHEKYKLERIFLRPKKDFSRANSKGSRGIFAWYILESGNYYDVFEKRSWRSEYRYFCKVTENGDIEEVPEKEVYEWVKTISK